MNYIRHLNTFFSRVKADPRLCCNHISLYMALFQYWNYNRFEGAFPVYRANIMQLSKIGSKNTYHKCIKQLHDAGYIRYHPAINRYLPVRVSMRRLDQLDDAADIPQLDLFNTIKNENKRPENDTHSVPVLTDTGTGNGPLHVPKPVHIIKQYKQVNSVHTENFEKNGKGSEELNEPAAQSNEAPGPPPIAEVEAFFQAHSYPLAEARQFWCYNDARGWMLAENAPIYHWPSIAHKWIINAKSAKGKTGKPAATQNLHTNNQKNYDEPL